MQPVTGFTRVCLAPCRQLTLGAIPGQTGADRRGGRSMDAAIALDSDHNSRKQRHQPIGLVGYLGHRSAGCANLHTAPATRSLAHQPCAELGRHSRIPLSGHNRQQTGHTSTCSNPKLQLLK
jgi:hypothetical protein